MSPTTSSTGVLAMRVSSFPAASTLLIVVWGPWQVGNLKAADYAEKARIWAHGLRLVDPTIKLVSCGREVS